MQSTERRTIDGLEFEIGQLSLKKQRAGLVRLMRIFGPALSALAKDRAGSLGDLDVGTISGALGQFLATLSEDDLEHFCTEFGAVSTVQVGHLKVSVAGAGDTVFQGKMVTMFKWLRACLEINYADFLAVLGPISARLSSKEKDPSPSTSPTV